jgi:hypothetical protein
LRIEPGNRHLHGGEHSSEKEIKKIISFNY